MKRNTADILVTNGIVLTLTNGQPPIYNGAVAIEKGRIIAVGRSDEFSNWKVTRPIDAKGGIIMPGLVNTHTHAAMTLFRGLADDLPLMTWLNGHIFPAESRLDHQMVYRGTLLACAEMIRNGTTCFCDMYLFEDAVAQAAKAAGVRAVVGEVLYDFPSPNYGPIEKGFAYTQMLIEKWNNDPLITIAVEPHSPYLCAPELLKEAFSISQTHNIPMVVHISEAPSEVAEIKKRHGKTPVGFLADQGLLSANLVGCHCVVLTEEDISLLKRHDVKVSHCPESNMKLASGIAPIPRLVEKGVCVGLGTDGCASNNNLDLFSEMNTAAKLHKVQTLDPTVLDAATVLSMGTRDGAKALGLDDKIGILAPDKLADLIVINTQKPHLTPLYNPVSHLVYAVKGSDVTTSIINGVVVMQDGRLLSLDLPKVLDEVDIIAADIRSSNQKLRKSP